MRCPDELELGAYLDGELRGDQAGIIARHIDGCRECASVCAALRSVKTGLARLEPISGGERLYGAVMSRVRREAGARPQLFWSDLRSGVRLAYVAAFLVLALTAGTLSVRFMRDREGEAYSAYIEAHMATQNRVAGADRDLHFDLPIRY